MKRDKSRLVPVKKNIVDKNGNVFQRTYWIKPDKNNTPEHNSALVIEPDQFFIQLSRSIDNYSDKRYYDANATIVKELSPNVKLDFVYDADTKYWGYYEPDTHRVVLNDFYIKDSMKKLLATIELLSLGKVKFNRPIEANFNDMAFRKLADIIQKSETPLHEGIHSTFKGRPFYTSAYEEGVTELFTASLIDMLIDHLTGSEFKLSGLFKSDKDVEDAKLYNLLTHGYFPYIYRLILLGRDMNVTPEELIDTISELRWKNTDRYDSSFLQLAYTLNKKYPNRVDWFDDYSTEKYLKARERLLNQVDLFHYNERAIEKIDKYAKDAYVTDLHSQLANYFDIEKPKELVAISPVKEVRYNFRSAVIRFGTVGLSMPLLRQMLGRNQHLAEDVEGNITYLQGMMKAIKKKFKNYQGFLNYIQGE
jgi:hypothetical protein